MKHISLTATLILGTLLYGCGEHDGSTAGAWTAEIYPDSAALTESRSLGTFPSYEACLEAAMEELGGDGVFNCSTN